MFQTTPERFCSGLSITFATEVSTESGDHSYRFAKKRNGIIRRNRLTYRMDDQRLPLGLLEENGAGHVGTFAAEFSQVIDSPCDDQIHGQTGLNGIGGAELPF